MSPLRMPAFGPATSKSAKVVLERDGIALFFRVHRNPDFDECCRVGRAVGEAQLEAVRQYLIGRP